MYKNEFDRKSTNILGVKIDSTTVAGVIRNVQVYIQKRRKFYILTPNPELVLKALEDPLLMKFTRNADISVPDGIGLIAAYNLLKSGSYHGTIGKYFLLSIKWFLIRASIIFGRENLQKEYRVIHGRELFMELIKLSNKNGYKVFLLGGEDDEAVGTKKILQKNYKNLTIETDKGPLISQHGVPINNDEHSKETSVVNAINNFSPHILFVGMGAGKQEKWLAENLIKLKIGGAMVVGNTFRFVSGKSPLAPKWVTGIGLEWLYRLLTGSQKLIRVWNAVVVFSSKVFWYKYNH